MRLPHGRIDITFLEKRHAEALRPSCTQGQVIARMPQHTGIKDELTVSLLTRSLLNIRGLTRADGITISLLHVSTDIGIAGTEVQRHGIRHVVVSRGIERLSQKVATVEEVLIHVDRTTHITPCKARRFCVKLFVRKVVTRDQIKLVGKRPVSLNRSAKLLERVVSCVVVGHELTRAHEGTNVVIHVLRGLLIEDVRTDLAQILVHITDFIKSTYLQALPLWHMYVEFIERHVGRRRVEVQIEVVNARTENVVIVDVVSQISIGRLRFKVGPFSFTVSKLQIATAFVRSADTIVPTTSSAENLSRGVTTVVRRVVTCGHRPFDSLLAIALLRDDVDSTTQGVGTVKHRGRPLDHFDTFNLRRIDQNRGTRH